MFVGDSGMDPVNNFLENIYSKAEKISDITTIGLNKTQIDMVKTIVE